LIKDYNREKSKIIFDKYGVLRWSLDTDIDFPEEGKLDLFWKGDIFSQDVQIDITVNGEKITLVNSPEEYNFILK
jgi:hypothetical protein